MENKEKTYTITLTQKELDVIKNDITLKSMSGKLEFDETAFTIGKILHKQIFSEKNVKR